MNPTAKAVGFLRLSSVTPMLELVFACIILLYFLARESAVGIWVSSITIGIIAILMAISLLTHFSVL